MVAHWRLYRRVIAGAAIVIVAISARLIDAAFRY
jgi:hypothetical protein